MQFIHPGFLFALGALAIPVIIHLFNFRRYKTVYFSNVRFLREVQEETTSRNRLKHLLVLAARLLALAFLIFAFAQPYIPGRRQHIATGKKYVSIYVDNSFSMNATSGNQSLLDKAKQAAREIAKGYGADDEFQLLTNDFEGRHQRLVGREEFISMADEVETSPAVRTLDEISKRQKDVLGRENGTNQVAYLLSDFQKNMGDINIDSSIAYDLIPLSADAPQNIYIDTCWFAQPVQMLNQEAKLIVKISNSGDKKTEGNRLVMKLNGQTKGMADFSIESNSFVLDTLSFTVNQPGFNKAELTIQDYPITYDDNYYLVFDAVNKINVLSVNDGKPDLYLGALFKNNDEFNYSTSATTVTAKDLAPNQLVVLDGLHTIPTPLAAAINEYVSAGGAVAVFPAANCEKESYNRFLNNLQASSITGFSEQAQDLAGINLQQNIFKDVFEHVPQNMSLPNVKKYYTFSRSAASNEEDILTLKDGSPFLSRYPYQSGSLYVCAVPLDKDYSELPVHAIFVPLLYKMALLNLKTGNISYFIGDKTRIEVNLPTPGGDKVFKIKGEGVEFIPEQFAVGNKILVGLNNQIKKAGFYTIGADNSDTTQAVALNFDRRESDLQFFDAAALAQKYPQKNVAVVNASKAEVGTVVKELDRGVVLWKWCIVLTLLFLAIEIALLRFWKV
ncbi:MAG TPA: BatA domain-containing protein [Chitinophagales bacterium]|nr:BatA domain-containing protein [Chitinophagales bacterium]